MKHTKVTTVLTPSKPGWVYHGPGFTTDLEGLTRHMAAYQTNGLGTPII